MAEKQKTYVSAVIYLGGECACVEPFLSMVTRELGARFDLYELVFVDDACRDGAVDAVRAFVGAMEAPPPVTMIHMSLKQGLELAMNAGLDLCVGDFIYEFDTMQTPYPADMVGRAYDACTAGSDIVSVSPQKNRGAFSALFYRVFNSSSGSNYRLRTDVFRLLTRRAVNRVHAISPDMPYRKAAYAASGLRLETLVFDGRAGAHTAMRVADAVDSLALYTNAAYRVSLGISVLMLALMLTAIVYTIAIYSGVAAQPAPGWTTTMLVMTGGFFGVFTLLTIVMKYLSLLVDLVFRRQKYLVESVEKIV